VYCTGIIVLYCTCSTDTLSNICVYAYQVGAVHYCTVLQSAVWEGWGSDLILKLHAGRVENFDLPCTGLEGCLLTLLRGVWA